MIRTWKSYKTNGASDFRNTLLQFAESFTTYAFFDSCSNNVYSDNTFDYMLAAGLQNDLKCNVGNAFDKLKTFLDVQQDWVIGYFSYDLKNEIEQLASTNYDGINGTELFFFVPQVLVIVRGNEIQIGAKENADGYYDAINANTGKPETEAVKNNIALQARIKKPNYIKTIENIQKHILEGDVYEINFCQEFYAEDTIINPITTFRALCNYSQAPFAVLLRQEDHYLISSSPERFLRKNGRKIISQPIKGTAKRGYTEVEDAKNKRQLQQSEKDKAENVMIVDLVRNDLTKSALTGSITVDELFGVYTFPQVHHLVSTVSAVIKENIHPVDVIKHAFPAGSMTGAPKVKAMQLIEQYESTKRGLYSGAIGYFTPTMDFDFSVVIRSILYHSARQYLSIHVGGAVVYDSHPENEYDECLVKLQGMMQALHAHLAD